MSDDWSQGQRAGYANGYAFGRDDLPRELRAIIGSLFDDLPIHDAIRKLSAPIVESTERDGLRGPLKTAAARLGILTNRLERRLGKDDTDVRAGRIYEREARGALGE